MVWAKYALILYDNVHKKIIQLIIIPWRYCHAQCFKTCDLDKVARRKKTKMLSLCSSADVAHDERREGKVGQNVKNTQQLSVVSENNVGTSSDTIENCLHFLCFVL